MAVIKRYSNRKLYDSDGRRYVTLEEVGEMIRRGEEVQVVDHATGADLTTVTLLQIIIDQEKRGQGFLSGALVPGLVQASGAAVAGLREGFKALIDPALHFEDEIRRRLKVLQERGTLTAEEMDRLSMLLLDPDFRKTAQAEADPAGQAAEPAPESEPVDPEIQTQYETLLQQVQALEQELENLKNA